MKKIAVLVFGIFTSCSSVCFNSTYDYIIVGSGPGGAVLAKTLSDDNKTSVLVLEAGSNQVNEQPLTDSTFAPFLEEQYFPEYFWQGVTVPQVDVNDQSIEWTTGRTFGGGSTINGLQYVRPTFENMAEWEALMGVLWSPLHSLEAFKNLENFHGVPGFYDPAVHGFSGPIDIRQAPVNPTQMAQDLVSAITTATGFPEIDDYNNPATALGPVSRWSLYQLPDVPYNRVSSATAFFPASVITPQGYGVFGRRLRVAFKSTLLRVLIKKQKAVGVQYIQRGCMQSAGARKGVIMAAGINDAQLVMLSGVGPVADLTAAGINVKLNQPNVGLAFTNQPFAIAEFSTPPGYLPLPVDDPQALYTGGAFLPNPSPGSPLNIRGVQLIGFGGEVGIGTENGTLNMIVVLLNPKSKGTIKIQSNDPLKQALVDEGFYQDPDDLASMRYIFRDYIANIGIALSAINPGYSLIAPSPAVLADDDLLNDYIRATFDQTHHMQSACRMAPFVQGGVVDAEGRVYGIKNLRVVDASIFPVPVDGNTSAPVFMTSYIIAQKMLTE